jgi:hypothetical protein
MVVVHSTLNIDVQPGLCVTFPILQLKRRDQRPIREVRYCFLKQFEVCLYGSNSGAVQMLLARLSMSSTTLLLNRACIDEKVVTEAEYNEVFDIFRTLLPVETKMKARQASLLPLTVAVAAATQFGRSPRTTALLRALSSLPTRWQQEIEMEENEAAGALVERVDVEGPGASHTLDCFVSGEVDLVLRDQLIEDEDTEQVAIDFALELLLTESPWVEQETETAKCQNMALQPVPRLVQDEFKGFEEFRNSPFNRFRAGAQVVSTTIDSDCANALRWLGFVKAQYSLEPTVKLFGSERVAEFTQAWMEKLRSLGLKSSTLAVYCNGVISISQYALTIVEDASVCPVEQLVHLRRQAESLAKVERLYQNKSENWIDWLE